MIVAIKILWSLGLILITPVLVGQVVPCQKASEQAGGLKKCIAGLMAEWALFWILCLPMTLLRLPFTTLAISYTAILCMLCFWGLVILLRKKQIGANLKGRIAEKIRIYKSDRNWIYPLIFFILLLVQIYFALWYQVEAKSTDDYEYVVQSVDTLYTNQLGHHSPTTGKLSTGLAAKRDFNSWTTYIAWLSWITDIPAAAVAHTLIAATYLILAYMVYGYLAEKLFQSQTDRWIFMDFLAMSLIFGYYSAYSLSFRLLVAIWQGKAVLSVIVVPFLIGVLMEAFSHAGKNSNLDMPVLLLTVSAACSMTMMGSGFVLLILAGIWVVYSIAGRKPWHTVGMAVCSMIPVLQLGLYLVLR